MTLRLNCLIEGEAIVFQVTVVRDDDVVSNLKEAIQSKQALDSLKDIDPHTLELWKPKDSKTVAAEPCNTLVERIRLLGNDLSQFADELDAVDTSVFSIFPTQPPRDYIHIILKAPPQAVTLKRTGDDPSWSSSDSVALNPSANHATAIADISQKLFDLWTKPAAKWDLQHLKEYLEKPLDPDWKIPLSHAAWRALLVTESIPAHCTLCSAEDLEFLFKQSEDETAVAILDRLKLAITQDPVNPSGSEISLVSFWDRNIRDILERCLGVASIRDSDQGTEIGRLRPDFSLLLANVCVFRGEEKRMQFAGMHPRDELKVKTRWVYNPAPYILGYYAIGVKVVLAAILPPGSQGGSLQVEDLISADLSSRRERIKNASRTIKLCGVLRWLQQIIGEGKDRDLHLQFWWKTYGLENTDDGKERVKYLKSIYTSLISKGVPNVDRLEKSENQHNIHGSYVDLEPRSIDEGPKSPLDVRNAVAHADPPVFRRDIRWQNIRQNCEDTSKWFLIDWDDALTHSHDLFQVHVLRVT